MDAPPSTVNFTVPVGMVDPVSDVTVTVKLTEAFTAGAVLDAEIKVEVSMRALLPLAGHAVASKLRSTDPNPVTWS
jgi:hypothetical protein